MELEGLVKSIHRVFADNSYTWRIDGKLKSPSLQDIEDTIRKVVEHLNVYPDGARYEVGRLIFDKLGSKVDVYVLHGTLELSEDEE